MPDVSATAAILELIGQFGIIGGALLLIVALATSKLIPKERLDQALADQKENRAHARQAMAEHMEQVEMLADSVTRLAVALEHHLRTHDTGQATREVREVQTAIRNRKR